MNPHLQNPTADELSSAIEDDIYEIAAAIARHAQLDVGCDRNMNWIRNRRGIWPNYATCVRFVDDDPAEDLQAAIARVQGGEIPRVWVLGPRSRPDDLIPRLQAGGFELAVPWTGMAMELKDVRAARPPTSDFTIRRVTSLTELDCWAEVVVTSLMQGRRADAPPVAHVLQTLLPQSAFRFYGAWFKGRLIATSLMFYSGNIVGVHMVSTLPEFRGRGAGRLVTLIPMLEARNAGYRWAVLQASVMGEPIYRNLGFREYCKMGMWYWKG